MAKEKDKSSAGKAYPILRMKARVYDAIHIEVQVVILHAIRVRLGGVYWNFHVLYHLSLLFLDIDDDERILIGQPSIERRDSHLAPSFLLGIAKTPKRLKPSEDGNKPTKTNKKVYSSRAKPDTPISLA
jgi:hypothetical protein